MNVIKFKAHHLAEATEGTTGYVRNLAAVEELRVLENDPHTYTAVTDDGKVVAVGGVVTYWKGRGEAWAVVHKSAKNHFVELHSVAKWFLNMCSVDFPRIEATVEPNFDMGHRWVKALGFKKEADLLRKYLPNGADCTLYARVS